MSDTNNTRKPLTKEQQEFSATHHDIVLTFLRRKRLPMDEFYDVVIFGYLEAVQVYDTRPELRERHAFEAIAIVKMRDRLAEHWKYVNRAMRKATVNSLYEPYCCHPLEESLASEMQPVEDAALANEAWERIAPHLTQQEMDTLVLKARGYTYSEIASAGSTSRHSVKQHMASVREKAAACHAV